MKITEYDSKVTIVEIRIFTNPDFDDGDYLIVLESFIGSLELNSESDDIRLIKECVEENLDELALLPYGWAQVILKKEAVTRVVAYDEDTYASNTFSMNSSYEIVGVDRHNLQ